MDYVDLVLLGCFVFSLANILYVWWSINDE